MPPASGHANKFHSIPPDSAPEPGVAGPARTELPGKFSCKEGLESTYGSVVTSGMFLVTTNKLRRLLYLNFSGHVRLEELGSARDELLALLADLPSGFRLVTDLSRLQSMDLACEAEISRVMELMKERGLSTVIRVIPEPEKDIGFNILAAIHYDRHVQTLTCASLEQAAHLLSL